MMRSPSKTFHLTGGALALLAGTLLMLGCDYAEIPVIEGAPIGAPRLGTVCSLATDTFSPTTVTVDAASTVCPSHVCLRPNEQQTTDTAALCSAECDVDSDCQGGVSRNPADPADRSCATGFACRIPIPDVSTPYACRKLCVCKDFLDVTIPATTPAGCPAGAS